MNDPVIRQQEIDRLLDRIEKTDNLERAKNYARQIMQIRDMDRRELASLVDSYEEEMASS